MHLWQHFICAAAMDVIDSLRPILLVSRLTGSAPYSVENSDRIPASSFIYSWLFFVGSAAVQLFADWNLYSPSFGAQAAKATATILDLLANDVTNAAVSLLFLANHAREIQVILRLYRQAMTLGLEVGADAVKTIQNHSWCLIAAHHSFGVAAHAALLIQDPFEWTEPGARTAAVLGSYLYSTIPNHLVLQFVAFVLVLYQLNCSLCRVTGTHFGNLKRNTALVSRSYRSFHVELASE